jgi:hypothetical protein
LKIKAAWLAWRIGGYQWRICGESWLANEMAKIEESRRRNEAAGGVMKAEENCHFVSAAQPANQPMAMSLRKSASASAD